VASIGFVTEGSIASWACAKLAAENKEYMANEIAVFMTSPPCMGRRQSSNYSRLSEVTLAGQMKSFSALV